MTRVVKIQKNGGPEVLEIKNVQLQEPSANEVLLENNTKIATIEIAKARGKKCERCWHYELDVGDDSLYKGLCGRCINVMNLIS